MDSLQPFLTVIESLDFSPLKYLIDLNDLRNLAAILGVAIGLMAASKKWGNKAVYFATIGASSNSPLRITSLSIANLKDKPLIIYEIHVIFKKPKRFFCLQKFNPPLVIKGLEATSFAPEKYSELEIKPNPFLGSTDPIDLILITESTAIKCKTAKPPESIVFRHMKKYKQLTKSKKIFNSKIYTKEATLALIYMYEGEQRTSFLLKNGHICDEWPFRTNMLSKDLMQSRELIIEGISEIAKQNDIQINIIELP
ncbi:hypothetical protein [Pseudomonas helvetica]|uniref:hypothetical protein n=1 Tax=Pseudomonas helvetica TaxID=3136738 RepID=UPI00326488AF